MVLITKLQRDILSRDKMSTGTLCLLFILGQYVYWDNMSHGPHQNIVKKGDKVSQETYCPGTKCPLGHFVLGQNVWEPEMTYDEEEEPKNI